MHVEAVEEPTEPGGDARFPLLAREIAQSGDGGLRTGIICSGERDCEAGSCGGLKSVGFQSRGQAKASDHTASRFTPMVSIPLAGRDRLNRRRYARWIEPAFPRLPATSIAPVFRRQ